MPYSTVFLLAVFSLSTSLEVWRGCSEHKSKGTGVRQVGYGPNRNKARKRQGCQALDLRCGTPISSRSHAGGGCYSQLLSSGGPRNGMCGLCIAVLGILGVTVFMAAVRAAKRWGKTTFPLLSRQCLCKKRPFIFCSFNNTS
jgi:hypothetical protein